MTSNAPRRPRDDIRKKSFVIARSAPISLRERASASRSRERFGIYIPEVSEMPLCSLAFGFFFFSLLLLLFSLEMSYAGTSGNSDARDAYFRTEGKVVLLEDFACFSREARSS